MSREDILNTVWTLWQSSPIAKRLLVIKRGYILGGGVTPQAKDTDLQDILTAFWDDQGLDGERAREFVLQLFLFGEQAYPAFVRGADGAVSLGYIDPAQIEKVITHPDNSMEIYAIVVDATTTVEPWENGTAKRVFRVIRKERGHVEDGTVVPGDYPGKYVTAEQASLEPWEVKMLQSFGLAAYSGSCFFRKVNSVSNQPRGYSDLVQSADWIDQADEVLFALADREQMAGTFSWDVTLANATPEKIRERQSEIMKNPPKKGSVNLHNDAETWKMEAPDLKQPSTIETFNAIVTTILGGYGFPRHWYGYGDETNRATAEAQGDPTWRSLEDDQALVQAMFLEMLEFARDQAEIAGAWKPGADGGEIDLPMPEMTAKDAGRITTSLSQLAQALMAAQEAEWMTKKKAAEVWAKVLSELGVEISAAEELEAVEKASKEEETADMQGRNDKLKAALADLEKNPPTDEENGDDEAADQVMSEAIRETTRKIMG